MCEAITRKGTTCQNEARYHVHVRTVPQLLAYGMETSPAGRSNTVCSQHVATVVDALSALSIRYMSALPTVVRFARLSK